MPQPDNPETESVSGFSENAGIPSDVATPAEYLASLIFLSYRYSQGGIGTQNRLLLHIEENYHPDLLQGPQSSAVRELTHKMVGPYFLNQRTHPATAIPWEDDSPEAAVKTEQLVVNELAGLFERFDDREQIRTFDSSILGIAQSVIVMDYDYLTRDGGRAGDSKPLKITVDPYPRDPYNSLFVSHSILGIKTNSAVYDGILEQLASDEILEALDENYRAQLRTIISVFQREHPEYRLDPAMEAVMIKIEEPLDG